MSHRHLASWYALSSGTRPPSAQLWTLKQKNKSFTHPVFDISKSRSLLSVSHRLPREPVSSGPWPCRRWSGQCMCPRWLWWTAPASSGWLLRPRHGWSYGPEKTTPSETCWQQAPKPTEFVEGPWSQVQTDDSKRNNLQRNIPATVYFNLRTWATTSHCDLT